MIGLHRKKRVVALTILAGSTLLTATNIYSEGQTSAVNTVVQEFKQLFSLRLGVPSVSLASPNAFGSGASVFAGGGYVTTGSGSGSFAAGGTYGDAYKRVGASLSWLAGSVGTQDTFGADGGLGLRLNRYLAQNTAIAAGAGNFLRWGSMAHMANSFYVAITQGIPCRFPISLNVGAGTGAFYSADDMQNGQDGTPRIFGGFGVSVLPGLSVIVDDAGDKLNSGVNYVYSGKHRIGYSLTLAEMNIINQGGGFAYFQAMVGISYSFV